MTDTAKAKRLYYRAWHRGTKESDLVLGGFADAELDRLTAAELEEFEMILDLLDADIMNWVLGRAPVPDDLDTPLMRRILSFTVSK